MIDASYWGGRVDQGSSNGSKARVEEALVAPDQAETHQEIDA